MKIVRLLFFSAFFLFLIITVISLFIPSRVRISRAVNVLGDTGKIWRQVDDMRAWPQWNPFFSNVSKDSIRFRPAGNGEPAAMEVSGTVVQWKEKRTGERIAVMQRKNQRSLINGWRAIVHSGSDSTTLQWYMDFQLRWYPWEKMASLLFERSYGAGMEQGLYNLKKLVENQPYIN